MKSMLLVLAAAHLLLVVFVAANGQTLQLINHAETLYSNDYETRDDMVSACMGAPHTNFDVNSTVCKKLVAGDMIFVNDKGLSDKMSHSGKKALQLDLTLNRGEWFYFNRYFDAKEKARIKPNTYFSGYLYVDQASAPGLLIKLMPLVRYVRKGQTTDVEGGIMPGGFGPAGYTQGADGWRFFKVNLYEEARQEAMQNGYAPDQTRIDGWRLGIWGRPKGNKRVNLFIDDMVIATDEPHQTTSLASLSTTTTFLAERNRYEVRNRAFHGPLDGRNYLDNSSFELGLTNWEMSALNAQRQEDSSWEIDDAHAYHGKRSLKISRRDPTWFSTRISSPQILWSAGKKYTFSFFAKAEGPIIAEALGRTFNFNGDWRRYTVTCDKKPMNNHEDKAIRLDVRGTGTLWLDALQLEEGTSASDYQHPAALTIGLATERKNNIFFAGEPMTIDFSAFNGGNQAVDATVTYSVKDFYHNTVASGTLAFPMAAAAGHWQRLTLPIATDKKGIFWVNAVLQHGETKKDFELNMARIDRLSNTGVPDEGFFGGYSGAQENEDLLLSMAESIGMKRANPYGPFYYAFAHPVWREQIKKGVYRVSYSGHADWAIEVTRRHRASVIGVLGGVPGWNRKDQLGVWLMPQQVTKEVSEDWRAFTYETVKRFKSAIRVWEVWPEAIHEPETEARTFVEGFLKSAYEAAKEADPRCMVIASGSDACPQMVQKAEAVFKAGGLKYLDGFSVHPYCGQQSPEDAEFDKKIDQIKRLIVQYGGRPDQGVWATEAGWQGANTYYHDMDYGENPGYEGTHSEERQADYIIRANILALAHGAKCYFSFCLNGGSIFRPFLYGFTYNNVGSPKAVYPAYAAMVSLLRGSRFVTEVKLSKGVRCYLFEKGKEPVAAIWSVEKDVKSVTMQLPMQSVELIDAMGNPLTPERVGNSIRFVLVGGSPTYLKGRDTKKLLLSLMNN